MKMGIRNMLIVPSLILLIAPFSVLGQTPPDLEVSDPQFTYDVNATFNSRIASSGRQGMPATTVTDSPVQQVSALFRNVGTKIVKSIEWEYIVFSDAKDAEVRHVHRIRNDKTLLPGETMRLEKTGYRLHHSQYKKARVTRIKYADGTIWQSTRTKG